MSKHVFPRHFKLILLLLLQVIGRLDSIIEGPNAMKENYFIVFLLLDKNFNSSTSKVKIESLI